jgi:hypothetical protein
MGSVFHPGQDSRRRGTGKSLPRVPTRASARRLRHFGVLQSTKNIDQRLIFTLGAFGALDSVQFGI